MLADDPPPVIVTVPVAKPAEVVVVSRDTRSDDAWGNRFRIRCEDEQVSVTSAGPDRVANNADDVRVSH